MGVRNRGGRFGHGPGRNVPGRRKAPPPATGREAAYLLQVKDARATVVVHLTDGRNVEGVVEYFDRDMVKITRSEGPHVFVRKSEIRYLEEATEWPARTD
jgi:sRNA-binding regulator protein Hfq